MNRKGFTLLELIVVLIVLAALVAIALPQYTGFIERGRAAEPITAMGAIKAGEEAVWNMTPNAPAYVVCANAAAIETNLGVTLITTRWTYVVTVPAAGTYMSTATRTAAENPGVQAGRTVSLQYTHVTGASVWGGNHTGAPRP